MAGDLNDVLRQIEEAAAGRAADHDMHPYTRADLHRLLDAFDDEYLIVAAWFLRAAASICIPPVSGALITVDAPIPLNMRWYAAINNLVACAPPSWFDAPHQRGAMMKALAEQAAATIEAPRPGTSR